MSSFFSRGKVQQPPPIGWALKVATRPSGGHLMTGPRNGGLERVENGSGVSSLAAGEPVVTFTKMREMKGGR